MFQAIRYICGLPFSQDNMTRVRPPMKDVAWKKMQYSTQRRSLVMQEHEEGTIGVQGAEELEEARTTQKLPTAPPLLVAPSPAALRDELEELVIRDLLGPAGGEEEEVDEARLRERYLVGMLAPNESQTPPEELESAGTAEEGTEEQGPIDSDSSQTTSLSPSTLGLSFCVNLEASELLVTARWATIGELQEKWSATRVVYPARCGNGHRGAGSRRCFHSKKDRLTSGIPNLTSSRMSLSRVLCGSNAIAGWSRSFWSTARLNRNCYASRRISSSQN
jgi:hypothetical protein